MKIISKFKDYYDGVQGYGGIEDDPTVYVRDNIEINTRDRLSLDSIEYLFNFLKSSPVKYLSSKASTLHRLVFIEYSLLCFCGKIYPLYKLDTLTKWHVSASNLIKELKELNTEPTKALLKGIHEPPGFWYLGDREAYSKSSSSYERLVKYSELASKLNPPSDLFIEACSPIFIYRENTIELNPSLRDIGFQTTLDSYTTYQEIEMYLNSVLVEKDTTSITTGDDEVIRNSKGFDNQSFKTTKFDNKKTRRKFNKQRKRKTSQ